METDGQQGGVRRQASGCEKLHQSPRWRRRLTALRDSKLRYTKGRMWNEPRDVLRMWHKWSKDQQRRQSWASKLNEWATDAAATAAVLTQLWQTVTYNWDKLFYRDTNQERTWDTSRGLEEHSGFKCQIWLWPPASHHPIGLDVPTRQSHYLPSTALNFPRTIYNFLQHCQVSSVALCVGFPQCHWQSARSASGYITAWHSTW